jgi:hypothetical protein
MKLVPIIFIIKIHYFAQSKYLEKFFFNKQNKLYTLEQIEQTIIKTETLH